MDTKLLQQLKTLEELSAMHEVTLAMKDMIKRDPLLRDNREMVAAVLLLSEVINRNGDQLSQIFKEGALTEVKKFLKDELGKDKEEPCTSSDCPVHGTVNHSEVTH